MSQFEKEVFGNHQSGSYWGSSDELSNFVPPGWLREFKNGKIPKRDVEQRSLAVLSWLGNFDLLSFLKATYRRFYHKWHPEEFDSEFKQCLLDAPWFPTTKGLKRPGEAFVKKPEIYEMFGDKIPYATGELDEDTCDFLGVHSQATSESIISYLEELSRINEKKADLSLVTRMYRHLRDYCDDDLEEIFKEKSLIYLPNNLPSWKTNKEVLWIDASEALGDLFGYLSPIYEDDLKAFFVGKAGVPESAETKQYADAWIRLIEEEISESGKVEAALELIYPKILGEIQSDSSEWPDWWGDFTEKVKLWTQKNVFVDPEQVYVPDNGELKKAFKDSLDFAWRPEKNSFTDCLPLYRSLGAKVLSESVSISLEEVNDANTISPANILTDSSKQLVYRFLWNECREEMDRLQESGILQEFLRTNEKECISLDLIYEVTNSWVGSVKDSSRLAYWDASAEFLYLRSRTELDQLRQETADTVARAFWNGQNLKHHVPQIYELLCASEGRARRIIEQRSWSLPADQQKWLKESLSRSDREQEEIQEESPGLDDSGRESASSKEADANQGDSQDGGKPKTVAPQGSSGVQKVDRGDSGEKLKRRPQDGSGKDEEDSSVKRGSYPVFVQLPDNHSGSGQDDDMNRQRLETEEAAIQQVMAFERSEARSPERKSQTNPGYDILSESENEVRYIEVKSLTGPWSPSGVALSDTQFKFAQAKGDQFWLYVVENVGSSKPQIHRIQNPAGLANRFHFDLSWSKVAQTGSATPSQSSQDETTAKTKRRSILDLRGSEDDQSSASKDQPVKDLECEF